MTIDFPGLFRVPIKQWRVLFEATTQTDHYNPILRKQGQGLPSDEKNSKRYAIALSLAKDH